MKALCRVSLVGAILFLCSCRWFDTQGVDLANMRALFRVPSSVQVLAYSSYPEFGGTFGREGLRISVVFKFDDAELANYLARIEEPKHWLPVAFQGRLPEIETDYTENSLKWQDLPLPPLAEELRLRFARVPQQAEITAIKNGKYWGTISEYLEPRGKPSLSAVFERLAFSEFPSERFVQFAKPVRQIGKGSPLSEYQFAAALAFVLGVLDRDQKHLYAEYQM